MMSDSGNLSLVFVGLMFLNFCVWVNLNWNAVHHQHVIKHHYLIECVKIGKYDDQYVFVLGSIKACQR